MFVSSTSAIDTEHYVQLSDSFSQSDSGYRGVPESDSLEGARSLLRSGYGQTKWVSEKLLSEAGRRGLRGHIIRPGYVVGDSQTAGELPTKLHSEAGNNSALDRDLRRMPSSHKHR